MEARAIDTEVCSVKLIPTYSIFWGVLFESFYSGSIVQRPTKRPGIRSAPAVHPLISFMQKMFNLHVSAALSANQITRRTIGRFTLKV